jgi:hypothetical protein
MRTIALFLGSLVAAAPAPWGTAPELRPVLEKLGEYAAGYHKKFREFVATEERVQKHYGIGLKAQQRTTVSDYYVVSLPSAPDEMREFRETLLVDGRPVSGNRGKVLDLLRRKSPNPEVEEQRILKESKRHDIGAFKRFEEFTNMGLLYIDRRIQPHLQYVLGAPQGEMLVLRFRETGSFTVARVDGDPAPATGTIYFTYPDIQVVRVDLTIHDTSPDDYALVRCIIDYAPGPEGLMLPSRCRHFMPGSSDQPEPGSWESDARYTNYRRFTSDVKLTVEAPVP